jgi:uncharacterized RDD family membrane protein YckC
MTQPPFHPQQQDPQDGYLVLADWSGRFTAYLLDGVPLVVALIVGSATGTVLDPSDGDRSVIAMLVTILIAVLSTASTCRPPPASRSASESCASS